MKDRLMHLVVGTFRFKSAIMVSIVYLWFLLGSSIAGQNYNDLSVLPAFKSQKAHLGLLLDVVNTGNRLVAVGERGHILRSDDQGHTWQQADSPTSVTLTGVYFPTPELGWAVGHEGVILHTVNGGDTWDIQMAGFKALQLTIDELTSLISGKKAQVAIADEGEKKSIVFALEDLEYRLRETRRDLEAGSPQPFMDIWFKDTSLGFAVGAFGMMFKTDNGGRAWQPLIKGISNPDIFHYYSINQINNFLVLVGEGGMMFRSPDWGTTWERHNTIYDGSFFGVIQGRKKSDSFAFGLRGTFARSTDSARTFELLNFPSKYSIMGALILSDGSLIVAGQAGNLFKSRDDGIHFTRISTSYPGCVALAETGDRAIILVGKKGIKRLATLD